MLKRSPYIAPASVSIKLYKALLKPIIEYSASVWYPFTNVLIKSIVHYPTINISLTIVIPQGDDGHETVF